MSDVSITGVVQAEYEYNALGQQVVRRLTVGGQTIHSVHDGDGIRIAEYEFDPVALTSTLLREYIWMNGQAVGVIEGGMLYLVRSDHIGRPVFATNTLGIKVWEASYLPFGGVHTSTGSPLTLRFPGQWFQPEAGLHQNWMRDYDPTTGRYVQGDPFGLIDGSSIYGYALQNPGRYTDPTGEFVPIVIFGVRIAVSSYGAYRRAIAARAAVKVAVAAAAGAGSGPSAPRVSGGEACDDACEQARERVRQAKRTTGSMGGCRTSDSISTLHAKANAWLEHCNARKQRDRICTNGPQGNATEAGEKIAQQAACSAYARCMALIRR